MNMTVTNFNLKVLIDARNKLGIPLEDNSRQSQADYVTTFDRYQFMQPDTFVEYVPHLRELWRDGGIRTAYDRRREFQLVRYAIHSFFFCFIAFYLSLVFINDEIAFFIRTLFGK